MQTHEKSDYDRLRAEGRWPQANEFREVERRRPREDGRTRQQARDESWSLMLDKFPPLVAESAGLPSPIVESEPNIPKVAIDMTAAPDFESALRWTWAAMGRDPATIDLAQAPHPGCVELLKFAKSDPKSFFAWVAKYDQKRQEAEQTQRSFHDDQRTHFKLIAKVRDYYRAKLEQQTTQEPTDSAALQESSA